MTFCYGLTTIINKVSRNYGEIVDLVIPKGKVDTFQQIANHEHKMSKIPMAFDSDITDKIYFFLFAIELLKVGVFTRLLTKPIL